MIKWEKPILISLMGTDTQGGVDPCDPGSGNPGNCYQGNSAGAKCNPNGTAAVTECNLGPAAVTCPAGSGN